MARNKDPEFKQFMITHRKKIGSAVRAAPVWTFQKANARLYNTTQKRTWKQVDMGKLFEKRLLDRKKQTRKHGQKVRQGQRVVD